MKQFSGDLNSQPTVFNMFDISRISFESNGHTVGKEIEVTLDTGNYLQLWYQVYQALGFTNDNAVSRDEFITDRAIMCFDFSRTGQSLNCNYKSPAQMDSLSVHIQFAKPLPEPIIILFFNTYQKYMTVTGVERQVEFMDSI